MANHTTMKYLAIALMFAILAACGVERAFVRNDAGVPMPQVANAFAGIVQQHYATRTDGTLSPPKYLSDGVSLEYTYAQMNPQGRFAELVFIKEQGMPDQSGAAGPPKYIPGFEVTAVFKGGKGDRTIPGLAATLANQVAQQTNMPREQKPRPTNFNQPRPKAAP